MHYFIVLFIFNLLSFVCFPLQAQKLSKKETKFWQAVQKNDINQVQYYLKKGINPDTKKENYYTPLYWALHQQKFDLAEILIKYKAKIDAPIYQNLTLPQNATLLMLACSGRNPQHHRITEFLLKHGVNPNITIKAQNLTHDFSALEIAIFSRNYFAVNLLLKYGANPNRVIKNNPRFGSFTSLGLALNQGVNAQTDEDIISILLANGAKVQHIIAFQNGNDVPYEVLFCSVKHTYSVENIAKKLKEKGANFDLDVRLSNYEGKLFPFVAKYNSLGVIQALVACQINHNSQIIRAESPHEVGFTALHFAIQKQDEQMAKYLLSLPAVDTTIRAKNGQTALDMARKNGMITPLFERQKIITQDDMAGFEADSLWQLVPKNSGKKKVDILNELGKGYCEFFQIQEAEKVLRQALDLAQKLDDQDGMATTYKYLSNLYFIQTFFEQYTTKTHENLYEIEEKYFKRKRDTLTFIPDEPHSNFVRKAIEHDIYSANKIEKNKFKPEFAPDVTIRVKRQVFHKEYWEKSKNYGIKAGEIRMAQSAADKQVWGIQQLLEILTLHSEATEKTEKLYLKWLNIRYKENDEEKVLWALKNIIRFYVQAREYEKAESYIQEICKIYEKTNSENIARLFINFMPYFDYLPRSTRLKMNQDSINQVLQKQKFRYLQRGLVAVQEHIWDDTLKQKFYRRISSYYEKDMTKFRGFFETKYLLNQYLNTISLQNDIDALVRGYFVVAYHVRDTTILNYYLAKIPELLTKISDRNKEKSYWIQYANFYQMTLKNYAKTLSIRMLLYDKNYLNLNEVKAPIEEIVFRKTDKNQLEKCLGVLENFLENHENTEEKIWAFRLQSRLWQQLKNYQKSAEFREKIMAFDTPQNAKKIRIDAADAGFLFQLAGNQEKAILYLGRALEITQKYLEFEPQVPIYQLKVAYCYESFEQFRKAEKIYVEAFDTARKNLGKSKGVLEQYIKNLYTAHDVSLRIGQFYGNQKMKKKALKYAETSLKVAKTLPNEKVFDKVYRIKKSTELIKKLELL